MKPDPDQNKTSPPEPEATPAAAGPYADAVRVEPDGSQAAEIMIDGIRCNGCSRKIEAALAALPGLSTVELNYTTHLLRVAWDGGVSSLERIVAAVEDLGFEALPRPVGQQVSADHGYRRGLLIRLSISAALAMQVMTFSIALYFGEAWGIDARFETLFRWSAFALTVPIMAVGASAFFAGAVRDLRRGRISMDVTVSLAIALAFLASLAAMAGLTREIYFDSVAMFTVFLLAARFIEADQRVRAINTLERLAFEHPVTAHRRTGSDGLQDVAAARLAVGDCLVVRDGEVIPADGRVIGGRANVDESLLTGESVPVTKTSGAAVIGGTTNVDGVLEVEVTRTVGDGTFAMVRRAAEALQAERPPIRRWADQIAGYFLTAILTLACALAAIGLASGDPEWLPKVIAVLIVTCPCALSLATPAALTATAVALSKKGVVVKRFGALQRLTSVTHCAFDKTGTLTTGRLAMSDVEVYGDRDRDWYLRLAAGLEQGSSHPLARAFGAAVPAPALVAELAVVPGCGVTGRFAGRTYLLGSRAWIEDRLGREIAPDAGAAGFRMDVYLADESQVLARFGFDDQIRDSARACVQDLEDRFGLATMIISGDQQANVDHIARAAGVQAVIAGADPAGKSRALDDARQGRGAGRREAVTAEPVMLAVGDGVNDAPMFGQADVAIAMGGHAALASEVADLTIVGSRLERVPEVIATALQMKRVLRQNFVWALAYNITAIPAAALGFVPPWLAAIGMTLSSVLVTLNAARIR